VTRFQRASWLITVLVTVVAYSLVIPRLPALGPATRLLTRDTDTSVNTASVTLPAGWDVDIASTAEGQPVVTRGGVRVSVSDAVWLGGSDRLVEHVADLVFSEAPQLPTIPDGADGADDEEWQLLAAGGAPGRDPREVYVVRRSAAVVLVVVRGPAAEVAAAKDAITTLVASVSIDGSVLDVEAAS